MRVVCFARVAAAVGVVVGVAAAAVVVVVVGVSARCFIMLPLRLFRCLVTPIPAAFTF